MIRRDFFSWALSSLAGLLGLKKNSRMTGEQMLTGVAPVFGCGVNNNSPGTFMIYVWDTQADPALVRWLKSGKNNGRIIEIHLVNK